MSQDLPHEFGGDWTETKLSILGRYLAQYTKVLKDKPSRRRPFITGYIDAFAGTGRRSTPPADQPADHAPDLFTEDLIDAEIPSLLDGSARIALKTQPTFDHYIFIERDAARCGALESLRGEFPKLAERIRVLQGDANTRIQELCAKNWKSHRAVLFLDPYGMQVDWETIEAIASTHAIDTWILFPLWVAVNRMMPKSGVIPETWRTKLDRFFGRSDWHDLFYQQSAESRLFADEDPVQKVATPETIARYYSSRLASVFAGVSKEPRVLFNSSNRPLYLLYFAAGNAKGAKIAMRIADHLLRPDHA